MRTQVTQSTLGHTHVHGNDVQQVLVDFASRLIFHDRDLDALRVNISRDLSQATAHIQPVRHTAGKANQLTLVKHRHGEREMVQVTACGVRIVRHQDVTRVDVFVAKVTNL